MVHNSHTANKKAITKKVQQLPRIQKVKQDAQVNKEKTIDPDMKQGERTNKLAATLKQLDQYKMIHKQGNSEESSQQEQQQDETKQQDNSTITSKAQQDAIEKEKLRKVTVCRKNRSFCYHF